MNIPLTDIDASGPAILTLSTRSANILAHRLYTRSAMRQYIGAGVFTHVSSEAE